MNNLATGWYAKLGMSYKGDRSSKPFVSPWDVFEYHQKSLKAIYLKNGQELLVVATKKILKK